MAQLPSAFNSDDYEDSYTPIPTADYNITVINSGLKRNKKSEEANSDKFGLLLNFEIEVLDGEYKGKRLFDHLNINHPNPTANEISQKTLASMCRACNKVTIEDSNELHGIPMIASVVVTEGDANYGPSNKIKMYKEYDGIIQPTEEQKEKNLKSWG